MSEANGHNGNGNGNGHPPINADVYPRIGKLETGMARLESNVQIIHEQVSKVNASIDKIADSLGKSREANYPFMVQTVGVCIALAASIGGVFIAPLRTADTYHEQQIQDIRAQIKQDHDLMIRMQEREQIRREMGK